MFCCVWREGVEEEGGRGGERKEGVWGRGRRESGEEEGGSVGKRKEGRCSTMSGSEGRAGRACEVTMRVWEEGVWEEEEDKEWKGWYVVGLSHVNNLPAKTAHSWHIEANYDPLHT